MGSIGWPELVVSLLVIVMVVVPIWIALKARPLGTRPYRWATWVAIETGAVSLSVFALGIPLIIKRGVDEGAALYLLLGVLALIGAIGVYRRKRVGAVFLIASELYLIVLGPALEVMYRRPGTNQPATGLPMLILAVANCFYFIKRWPSMEPGLG